MTKFFKMHEKIGVFFLFPKKSNLTGRIFCEPDLFEEYGVVWSL